VRRTSPDGPSLVAGATLLALGGLLLADALGALDLTFAWLAPIVCAAVGAVLLAVGLGRAD
jgi:membrane protein implicated in regulation of membrane protease activity